MGTMQGDALIMANFRINPKELQVTQWGEYYAKAIWLEEWRLKNQADMFKNLFGGND
ncbi:hypothetical protein [Flavobacterium psychrophilum]|uniref:hypothetical protein n=1 Tax=Flavobacterium psychrophilum TaxID=96345 RepID=UPI00141BCA3D|nr:hypothetical protein [Flavobacterium psychrophilum]MCB6232244.1 hypothetical protein [Flavobacterium psychrophilum]MEB3380603.1 hypothetical protein [Flavobacterium psychrophilum]